MQKKISSFFCTNPSENNKQECKLDDSETCTEDEKTKMQSLSPKKPRLEDSPISENVREPYVISRSAFDEITVPLYEKWMSMVKPKHLENVVPPDSYDLTGSEYHPITNACWRRGEKIPFRALCKAIAAVDGVSKRLQMLSYMERFFMSIILLTPSDLLPCISLLTNQIYPTYEGKETGIGDNLLFRSIASATGRDVEKIKSLFTSAGDLGSVTKNLKTNQLTMKKPVPLTIDHVYQTLRSVTDLKGSSSQKLKFDKITGLIIGAEQEEAIYLPGILKGKLRWGLAEKSIIAALACADTSSRRPFSPGKSISRPEDDRFKRATELVKTAIFEMPNYQLLIENLLRHGSENLSKHCTILPGYPVKPMLANAAKDLEQITRKHSIDDLICEYKYDGERAQIHRNEKGDIFVFSRNQENNTEKYPDIVQFFTQFCSTTENSNMTFIMDCEVVAWNSEKNTILPFQVLTNRKRKAVGLDEIKIVVCLFSFDLLYLNGMSLLSKPLQKRHKILRENFQPVDGKLQFAQCCFPESTEEILKFVDEAVNDKCEGVMIKTLTNEATYEIAKRSHSWFKFKKDYIDSIGDTLDLIVMGGYLGKGKRTGNCGAYLLGCYDAVNQEYQSICKIGTGFTDDDLSQLHASLDEFSTSKPHPLYKFDNSLACDKWYSPSCVWEVKAADLTISPIHFAAFGLVNENKGVSLRFPRFIRIREDKSAEDATTSEQVADMYINQANLSSNKPNINQNGDDHD